MTISRSTIWASSLVLVLMTWTYSGFFFFDYMYSGNPIVIAFQILALVSWVILIAVPVMAGALTSKERLAGMLLFYSGAARIGAQLILHIVLAAVSGRFYADYLVNYPLFLFADLALPVFYIVVGRRVWKDSAKRP